MVKANKGNRTPRRGKGFPRHTLAALREAEKAALRQVAAAHGYNELTFLLAIVGGELATVLLDPDDRDRAIRVLAAHADPALQDIAAQLRRAAEREQAAADLDDG